MSSFSGKVSNIGIPLVKKTQFLSLLPVSSRFTHYQSWLYNLVAYLVGDYEDKSRALWTDLPRETLPFPYWVIEPELLNDIKDLERNPGSAVFQAVRRLEIIVHNIGEYPAKLIGKPLIEEAMGESERGRLKPLGATEDERQAWFSLFRGAIGAFKNPESHRDQQLKLEDAIGQILAVNMLLRKLKQDFPDKFRKEEPTNSEDEEDE